MPVMEILQDCTAARAVQALERGHLLLLPNRHFSLIGAERALIEEGRASAEAKNISFTPATGMLKGDTLAAPGQAILVNMMARFGEFAEELVREIAPGYAKGIERGRASFRPVEIAGRQTSWRKDDTRLHVDAFPSTPARGRRILRVFANMDQSGMPRRWRVADGFETHAAHFLPYLPGHIPGAAAFLAFTHITKTRRTRYDEMMLGLHDAAKRDLAWQACVPAEDIEFQPGQIWMVFTDQLFHAATSGRNALEQTFYINQAALAAPETAPLATLTRLTGRQDLLA